MGESESVYKIGIPEYIKAMEEDIEAFNAQDVNLLFLNLDSFDFKDKMRDLLKKYEVATGQKPKFDLVFVADDLGRNDDEKRANLRRLKAMKESTCFLHGVVEDIVVKGDHSIVDLDANVFSSGVRFEELK